MSFGKYLNPQNDFAFKRLFGSEKNQDILISLLNDVLGSQLAAPVREVKFLSPVQDPEVVAKKQSMVDVLCRDQKGVQYIIEMQVASTTGFQERAQYYAAKAFTNQMQVGGRYEHLKKVIFLAFTNFMVFPNKAAYKSEHITLDKKTLENNLNKLSFTFVELPKFEAQRLEEKKSIENFSEEERFYYFLHHASQTTPEEFARIIQNSPIIERAYKELDAFFWTEEEVSSYEAAEKRERDFVSSLLFAREEGREDANRQTARNLHQAGFSIEKIAQFTGSSMEVVQQWLV